MLGENFKLFDSGLENPGNRIMIFGTEANLERFERHRLWHVDGTFKSAPGLFYQVFTIHGNVYDETLPLVWGLLCDKEEATYKRVFEEIHRLRPGLNPERIMLDFETAIHNAVRSVWPAAVLRGCHFHHSQALRLQQTSSQKCLERPKRRIRSHHCPLFVCTSICGPCGHSGSVRPHLCRGSRILREAARLLSENLHRTSCQ